MYDGVVVCLMIELTVAEVANVAVEVTAFVAFVNPVVLNLSIMYPRGPIPGITCSCM
jgi:hypothetical protein